MPRHLAEISALAMCMALPLWAGATYTRDEAVKIAVHDRIDINFLITCSVVFNECVGAEYIRSDL